MSLNDTPSKMNSPNDSSLFLMLHYFYLMTFLSYLMTALIIIYFII